jgi:hypothetical protein
VHLSAYVDLPLDDVLEHFADPGFGELLAAAMRTAMGVPDEVAVHSLVAPPVWESGANARVPVEWRITGRSGRTAEGSATISLLVVQSGHDAITELLVAMPVSEELAHTVTETTHRVLNDLIGRLEAQAR